jgi:hypothetical protein
MTLATGSQSRAYEIRLDRTEAATSTPFGVSRKTLPPIRSIVPCSPNVRPEAKSIIRLASSEVSPDRSMEMTSPARKPSPIERTSA